MKHLNDKLFVMGKKLAHLSDIKVKKGGGYYDLEVWQKALNGRQVKNNATKWHY
ncbi:MAG: hypothetical protein NC131_20310 [Roseburia sp.]|nr:hypothetical protein [Roseburia sp.]